MAVSAEKGRIAVRPGSVLKTTVRNYRETWMRVRQHMKRWTSPPAKSAKIRLSQPRRVFQFYLRRTSAGMVRFIALLFQTCFLRNFNFCVFSKPLTFGCSSAFSKKCCANSISSKGGSSLGDLHIQPNSFYYWRNS